jgi:hypothetical protein
MVMSLFGLTGASRTFLVMHPSRVQRDPPDSSEGYRTETRVRQVSLASTWVGTI